MRDALPAIPIPLRDGNNDAMVSLAEAFERGQYANFIDYSETVPPPEITEADIAWIKTITNSVAG